MSSARRRKIAVVPGDGIGPEVIAEGKKLLEDLDAACALGLVLIDKDWGAERYLSCGRGMPEDAIDELKRDYDAVLFGAVGDPRIPDTAHGREILLGMRFGLDLFANVRPIAVLEPGLCPLKDKRPGDIDFIVVRENTEDLYVSMGGRFREGTPDEVAVDESMNTYRGCARIIRYAFELARRGGRKKVTLCDKSNAVRYGGALWQRVFHEVAEAFPDIEPEHRFADVAAMELVTRPEHFDVIVANNLFGDILSDIGAGLLGSLGLAASANLHPGAIGLFEPVHGSAPDIAGQGIANPLATFLTVGLLLYELGCPDAAQAIQIAVAQTVAAGETTPDLNGTLSTSEVSKRTRARVLAALEGAR